MNLYLDLECFSYVDLAARGAYVYAEHPLTEILLWGYAIDKEPAKVWDLTAEREMPEDLKAAWAKVFSDPTTKVIMHNGMMFDRLVLKGKGWGAIPPAQVVDTMVQAYECALPGSLGELCRVLRLPQDKSKDKEGRDLVHLFCKPLGKNRKLDRETRHTSPEKWAKFVNYCRLDVESMREVLRRLPHWNYTSLEVRNQALDAKINDRGMLMDLDLARGAVKTAEEVKAKLASEFCDLTGGRVRTPSCNTALASYITEQGFPMDSVDKEAVTAALADEYLPANLRRILEIKQMASKSSAAKFTTLIDSVSEDGRLRGALQFRGASRTGRFAGRRFQAQNLPRPSMSNEEIEEAIELCKHDLLSSMYEDPMKVLTNLLRGEIIVPDGKKMIVADYSNVEGRVLAWLAGAQWKLDAFRAYDKGEGPDLYKLAYSRAFGMKPEQVTKAQRQVGKVLELGLGYGGGVGAFVKFAPAYGVDLHEMYNAVRAVTLPSKLASAEATMRSRRDEGLLGEIDEESYVACELVKHAWRDTNPEIVRFWRDVEAAFRRAIDGECVAVGKLMFDRKGGYVRIRLPSGRYISYPQACTDEDGRITYMAPQTITPRWAPLVTHGGKLCLAGDTQVITRRGVVRITDVLPGDEVWDGVEWVVTDGVVANGVKEVIEVAGVRMTPDHKVLTEVGWIDASKSEGHYRAPCGLPSCEELRELGWSSLAMERAVYGLRAHTSVPPGAWVSFGAPVRQAGLWSKVQVFDLINCGPRHRFAVVAEGGPMLTHNCENATQAVACDLLTNAMINLEAKGYHVILTIHDECLTEVPDAPAYTVAEMEASMTLLPEWGEGLVLNAEGFEAKRYRK